MADTKAIKTKLKTVGNIKKITRAMEMVARSKMKRAIDHAFAIRPFAYFGLEFLVNFSDHTEAKHLFYEPTNGTRTLIVNIAGNKGLCGGYNGNMFREVKTFLDRENLRDVDYISIGKYAVQHAQNLIRSYGGTLLASFTNFSENISLAEAETLAETIKKAYLGDKGNSKNGKGENPYARVMVAFTNFESVLSQKPTMYQLLPLSPEIYKNQLRESEDETNRIDVSATAGVRDWSSYIIEPSADAILDTVIPKLVTVQIYQALLDARASEEGARMIAMKNATENAEDIEDTLTLSYNHIRQEGITRELSEIVAGTLN